MTLQRFLTGEAIQILDKIGQNIFVTDVDLTITYVNDYASTLVYTLEKHTNLSTRQDYLNKNLGDFYHFKTTPIEDVLRHYQSFPYETTFSLFNKYIVRVLINPIEIDGQTIGYLHSWEDLTEYEAELRNSSDLLEEMYTPILETYLDDVLLIPIVGTLTSTRVEHMRKKVLAACEEHRACEVIFDFTGLSSIEDMNIVHTLQHIENSIGLLGAKSIVTGFSPKTADLLGEHVNMVTSKSVFLPSLRHAMMYCMERRGMALVKKE